jgi:hypothetical protein
MVIHHRDPNFSPFLPIPFSASAPLQVCYWIPCQSVLITGLIPLQSIRWICPFDPCGYYTKISLVVLPLDAMNLCVLPRSVLLRMYARKSYTYILPAVQRGNRKQTYLKYNMLDILFTFCVIIYTLCKSPLAIITFFQIAWQKPSPPDDSLVLGANPA